MRKIFEKYRNKAINDSLYPEDDRFDSISWIVIGVVLVGIVALFIYT